MKSFWRLVSISVAIGASVAVARRWLERKNSPVPTPSRPADMLSNQAAPVLAPEPPTDPLAETPPPESIEILQRPAPPSATHNRGTAPVTLIVLHDDARPADIALKTYTIDGASFTPHYHIDREGIVTQLAPEELATTQSGTALWKDRQRDIDTISIGIALERSPAMPFVPIQLEHLHWLINVLMQRYALTADDLVRWEAIDQQQRLPQGSLIAVTLPPPPVPVLGMADVPAYEERDADTTSEGVGSEASLVHTVALPLVVSGERFGHDGIVDDPAMNERLWLMLQHEAYRQRGEGFHREWAFHLFAGQQRLGAPLATGERLSYRGSTYAYQPFAHDTLYNQVPQWSAVQRLYPAIEALPADARIGGSIPATGLTRDLLAATYRRTSGGHYLYDHWPLHRTAVAQRLGPPLTPSYAIQLEGRTINMQVFALDTLYTFPPEDEAVLRLRDTPPGVLRDMLWIETCKVSGSTYDPKDPFFQLALEASIGTPLTSRYTVQFEGTTCQMQVFAGDTLYALPNTQPRWFSALPLPDFVTAFTPAKPTPAPELPGPDDALGPNRPIFGQLPIPGRPPVTQFFGYTRFAAGPGRGYYTQTQGRHSGIDFGVDTGTPLLSVSHGVVMCAGVANRDCPFGGSPPMLVIVRYGTIYAIYGHASAVSVRPGQRVAPGDQLGLSGELGGPHLHFELRPVPKSMLNNQNPAQPPVNSGIAVNPLDYFSPTLNDYFTFWYAHYGGDDQFCQGALRDQEPVTFGAPVDTRPCVGG
ncbi:MAG: peptidoglycan DD-metalloendopeptidase family protein [Chloroflexaceae bacterium]|nr:peptidoglycan DD-metalloendopeptidase family protein [Chloroflexaceae bacterium]